MKTPWKIHGKNRWIPLKTMEHGAGTKFHGFHGDISMLSLLASDRKIVRIFQMKAWEAWDIKPWKTIESMGIYKKEIMRSMVFSSILLIIISRKHGKHEKLGVCANEFMPPPLLGSLVAAGFLGLY